MDTTMEMSVEPTDYDVDQAYGWGAMSNMSNMTIDTGAAAQGFAPEVTNGLEEPQQAYSNNYSLVSLTGLAVRMPQALFGGQYPAQQNEQAELEQFIQQAHQARTQSDPATYTLGPNGQFSVAGGGVPFHGQQQMPFRPASDGQINISKSAPLFFHRRGCMRHLLPRPESSSLWPGPRRETRLI